MIFSRNRLTSYTDDILINELQKVAKKLNSSKLTTTFFDKHSKVHSSTIRKRFGSWKEALQKANLETLFDKSNKQKTKQEILNELYCISNELNTTTLTIKLFNEYSKFNIASIRSTFGSWSNALNEANLKKTKLAKRYTEEECFDNLLSVWTYYGRQPTYQEIKKEPSKVGAKAYLSRWGTWSKALDAFVKKINDNSSKQNIKEDSISNKKSPKNKQLTPENKRDIKLGLRYDILKRDSFKCVICGQSPATNQKITLHIDHIIPFSKGGKTKIENLRTLCSDCNLGKSDKT